MTFVVAGISFSKFQSMNLIISVSQSSAWDASCLVSLHGTPGASRRFVNVCTHLVTLQVQRGVKRGRVSKARSKPISQRRGADSSARFLSDELVPKQTGLASISRWKIVFPSNSRDKCHDASASLF